MTETSERQLTNADFPAPVTLSGILIDSSRSQRQNAYSSIYVTPSGISYEDTCLPGGNAKSVFMSFVNKTPSFPVYAELFSDTSIDSREVHEANAPLPIDVTLCGTVIDFSAEQAPNADSPIDVTLCGIVSELKDEQAPNAATPISSTLSGMVTQERDSHL